MTEYDYSKKRGTADYKGTAVYLQQAPYICNDEWTDENGWRHTGAYYRAWAVDRAGNEYRVHFPLINEGADDEADRADWDSPSVHRS